MRRFSGSFIPLGLLTLLEGCATPEDARLASVPFKIGLVRQQPGDEIRVVEIRGDRPTLEVGGHYVLSGTVTLASRDKATLALWCANGDVEATQRMISVLKGAGEFRFDFRIRSAGYLHLSFYPRDGGEGFGSTYFGQDPWVFRPD